MKELAILLKNITILYVEDDVQIQEQMSKALGHFSDNIYIASTGKEGLELYYAHNPHIIISDIMMPKLNGLDFVQEVRKNNIHIPIILLTACTQKKYLLPAANLNIQAYLIKPIQLQELKDALYKAIHFLNEYSNILLSLPNKMQYNKLNSELLNKEGEVIRLNKKEKKLFDLLLENTHRVVTYNEIENHVWDDYYEVMTSMALRTLIKNLRKKLSSDFIENISGQGYKVTL